MCVWEKKEIIEIVFKPARNRIPNGSLKFEKTIFIFIHFSLALFIYSTCLAMKEKEEKDSIRVYVYGRVTKSEDEDWWICSKKIFNFKLIYRICNLWDKNVQSFYKILLIFEVLKKFDHQIDQIKHQKLNKLWQNIKIYSICLIFLNPCSFLIFSSKKLIIPNRIQIYCHPTPTHHDFYELFFFLFITRSSSASRAVSKSFCNY